MTTETKIAMVAITKHGTQLLTQLASQYANADMYISSRCSKQQSDFPEKNQAKIINAPIKEVMGNLFKHYDLIVLIFAIGAAVRLMAPWLKSKREDPGVVVIDDSASYVIPILSGHIGGANAFALDLANKIQAQAVLTTASEARSTLAVDILGREIGWTVDSPAVNQLKVAAQLVNEEPIAVILETVLDVALDDPNNNWWPKNKKLPDNIHLYNDFNSLDKERYHAFLWVSHYRVSEQIRSELAQRLVVYKPPAYIVLGLGCDRNTPIETIETAVKQALEMAGYAYYQVVKLASIDKKADEVGLLDFAKKYHLSLDFYSAEQLSQVDVPNPSEVVRKYVGTPAVAEAAALLSAKTQKQDLIIEKHKYRGADKLNATVSIARYAHVL